MVQVPGMETVAMVLAVQAVALIATILMVRAGAPIADPIAHRRPYRPFRLCPCHHLRRE